LSSKFSGHNTVRTITKLTSGYHTHGFVIDYEEAKQLFRDVRQPTDIEELLEELLLPVVRSPIEDRDIVKWLEPGFSNIEGQIHEEGTISDDGSQGNAQRNSAIAVSGDDGKGEESEDTSSNLIEDSH
jgi:hypothetical protein